MDRDYRSEAKQVVRLAGKSKEFKASAAVIRGAINNVYEQHAESLLRQYASRAAEMGLSTKQFHDQVATMLLLEAAEAVIRASKRAKANPRASRPRIKNHSGADIKRQLSLAGQEIKQASAIYRRGDAAQATSMLQRLIFRSGAVNAILNDSTVSHSSHLWLRANGAAVALGEAIDKMRDTSGVPRIQPEHHKRPGAKRKGALKGERVANPKRFAPRNLNPAVILSSGTVRPAEWDLGWTAIGGGRVVHSTGGLIERKSGGYRVVLPSGAYALTASDGHMFKSMGAAKRAYFAQKGVR